MARYRKIDPRIWNDEKFRSLSDQGKLVFFMLLTHPNMTALGAMRATMAGLAEELGWSAEAFREAFHEGVSKGMAEHDPKACFVSLPRFLKYNAPESPNVIKAWVGALDLLPECELKTRVVARSRDFAKGLTHIRRLRRLSASRPALPALRNRSKHFTPRSCPSCQPSRSGAPSAKQLSRRVGPRQQKPRPGAAPKTAQPGFASSSRPCPPPIS
jgi:hypothetical protein